MRTWSRQELIDYFIALGLGDGDRIVVHSRLLSFGAIENGVTTVYDALRSVIGDQGTIVVPTYTLRLSENDCFDPRKTPSQSVGAFPEFVRQLSGAIRSKCPLHSHAAIGPHAEILNRSDALRSFGRGSDFDLMEHNDFKLLLLGCSFHEGATYIHHIEAEVEVPYRRWIQLQRRILAEDGSIVPVVINYYGKIEQIEVQNHLYRVEEDILMRGWANSVEVTGSIRKSFHVSLKRLGNCVRSILADDPWALVQLPHASIN